MLNGSERLLFSLLQNVSRAAYRLGPPIKDVCVDHDGTYVLMAEEYLDHSDVLGPLKQVLGKGMVEGVAGRPFVDSCFLHSCTHCKLNEIFSRTRAI